MGIFLSLRKSITGFLHRRLAVRSNRSEHSLSKITQAEPATSKVTGRLLKVMAIDHDKLDMENRKTRKLTDVTGRSNTLQSGLDLTGIRSVCLKTKLVEQDIGKI